MRTSCCKHCKIIFEYGYQSAGIYCSLQCVASHRTANVIARKRAEWEANILADRKYVRKFLEEERGYNCAECGISEWNGKPITLWVDHINGNAADCRRENYQLVCPNCDSQSQFFGAKNYGNGRKARGLPQYG